MKKIILYSIMLLLAVPVGAQVRVPFTKRTSNYLSTGTDNIYHIKGDFQMIGNTNMTLVNYGHETSNSNLMRYVDIDNVSSTVNSSSATLEFPKENEDMLPGCSNILYAGLYWTGRAHDGVESPMAVYGGGTTSNILHDGNIDGNKYKMTYSSSNSGSNYTGTFTFAPIPAATNVVFTFRNNGSTVNLLTYKIGSGATQAITGYTVATGGSGSNAYIEVTFITPITINTGNSVIYVKALRKRSNSNSTSTNVYATVGVGGKFLNKNQIKIKHTNQAYQTYTANANDIYYPSNADGNMYSAYVDVTSYVQQHGVGEYFVADIAASEGDGGGTGFYGGWGMIVVYENSKMKWRDIAVFDGHAYIYDEKGGANNEAQMTYYELPVSGFNTAQNGNIRIKYGLIAGEGDRNLNASGTLDRFAIINKNNNWVNLSHANNSVDNYFNSSIFTGGNDRNPELLNNTGIDIVMDEIPNVNNNIIENNQTQTKFRYGTNQDTYIIFNIALAVDAYVPEIAPEISILNIDGQPYNPGDMIQPGQEIEYQLEIRNPGNEGISNLEFKIPIPFNASYVNNSASANYYAGSVAPSGGGNPGLVTSSPDYLKWNIVSVPHPNDPTTLLARMTFKLKITDQCAFLFDPSDPTYTAALSITGTASGTGTTSGVFVDNQRFIRGYSDGACQDEPILGAIETDIDTGSLTFELCDFNLNYELCQQLGGVVKFDNIINQFPSGTQFYSAVTTVTDPESGVEYVVPASGAQHYVSGTTYNLGSGAVTVHAIPPGVASFSWPVTVTISQCNFWYGTNSNDWLDPTNWTNNVVPAFHQDVVFATVNNWGSNAIRDLHLMDYREIGNLINLSPVALVVTTSVAGEFKKLYIEGKADVISSSSIVIDSKLGEGNGTLIFQDPVLNANLKATVKYDSKSQKVLTGNYPREWQYIGAPIKDAIPTAVFGSDVSGSKYGSNVSIRKYSEAKPDDPSDVGDKWLDVNVNVAMTPFEGYELVQPAQNLVKYDYVGTLNLEDHTLNLTFTPAVYYRGNYILANSYTAPIALDKLAATDFVNLEQAVYLYNTGTRDQWEMIQGSPAAMIGLLDAPVPGSYAGIAINLISTISTNRQIPSMNGFLVRRLANSNGYVSGSPIQFKFRYDALDTYDNSETMPMRAKQAENNEPNENVYPLIRVAVKGSTWADQVYLATVPYTSKYFDNGWDSRKMLTATDDQIFVLTDKNERFNMSSDSDLNGTLLGFYRATSDTQYTLDFKLSNMDGVYESLYIEDLQTGVQTEITDGLSINFTANSSSPDGRFRLHAVKADKTTTDVDNGIGLNYYSDQIVSLINNSGKKATFSAYDVSGKVLVSQPVDRGFSTKQLNLNSGVYILELKTGDATKNLKVIVK